MTTKTAGEMTPEDSPSQETPQGEAIRRLSSSGSGTGFSIANSADHPLRDSVWGVLRPTWGGRSDGVTE